MAGLSTADLESPTAATRRALITGLVEAHSTWRRRTINLIASENVMSPPVQAALVSDLDGRYADYPGRDLSQRRYRGNRYIVQIEETAADLARETFRARYVELRPLAGHLAGLAVLMGLCRPGDVVLELDRAAGGHREAGRFTSSRLVSLEVQHLPFDGKRFNVDIGSSLEQIARERPRVVVLGSSNFLFPHPVREIADTVHAHGGYLVYDASHVMGFMAARQFQDPLAEGADIVFGSTHKTFPGPQGGIIYSDDDDVMNQVTPALVPALVTNHHPARMPALALALVEMQEHGEAYMNAVRSNGHALGHALDQAGVAVVRVDGSATNSHCLLVPVDGSATEATQRLEEAGIITTSTALPAAQGAEGVRIGVQEVTRRGATAETMTDIARLISDALHRRRRGPAIAADASDVAAMLDSVAFALA